MPCKLLNRISGDARNDEVHILGHVIEAVEPDGKTACESMGDLLLVRALDTFVATLSAAREATEELVELMVAWACLESDTERERWGSASRHVGLLQWVIATRANCRLPWFAAKSGHRRSWSLERATFEYPLAVTRRTRGHGTNHEDPCGTVGDCSFVSKRNSCETTLP